MRRLRHFDLPTHQTTDGLRLRCVRRGKYVPAKPEEYVRQDVLHSLLQNYGYPLASLRAEEPVARGSDDRRRADVFVELPAAEVGGHSVEILPSEVTTQDPHQQRAAIMELLGRLGTEGAVQIVHYPETMCLDLDGRPADCRPLGVRGIRGGIALVLQCDAHAQLGLPPVFNVMVLGLKLRRIERRMACVLGLPPLEFHSVRNRKFSEVALEQLSQLELCRPFNEREHYDEGIAGGLSDEEQGRCGWVVLRSDPHAPTGVLARVDLTSSAWHTMKAMQTPPRHEIDSARARYCAAPCERRTLIVVECKAPSVHYKEEVKQQGSGYAEELGALYLVLTSGISGFTRVYWLGDGKPEEIEDDIPTYEEATSKQKFRVRRVPPSPPHSPLPPDAEGRNDLLVCHARTRDAVGADLDKRRWAVVLRVDDALCDPCFNLGNYLDPFGLEITGDHGMAWHEPTHPNGKIAARFRNWSVRDQSGQEVQLGVAMRALRAVRYHKDWRGRSSKDWNSRRSTSILIGATQRGAVIGNALEYNMGRADMEDSTGTIRLTHDGRHFTEYVRPRAPGLVHNGFITLGALPTRQQPKVEELREFLARFVVYSKLRGDYKRECRDRSPR